MESERVYVGAVTGIGFGSIVENPEDLSIVRHVTIEVKTNTHANHGEQNKTSCCSLFGTAVGVYQRVYSRCGENEACGEEADNLWTRQYGAQLSLEKQDMMHTATLYVCSASDATVTRTPRMQKKV